MNLVTLVRVLLVVVALLAVAGLVMAHWVAQFQWRLAAVEGRLHRCEDALRARNVQMNTRDR